MDKWNLVIDVALCENCNNCFLADKDEYCGNDFPGYTQSQPRHGHRWIDIKRRERGSGSLIDVAYLPTTCNQCDDAPCIKACSNGEVYKRDDGIVMIDPDKAKGKKDIVASCPYGNIWWNDEHKVAQKWFFDAHLLDGGWKKPRCVQSCPTGAMSAAKITDEEMQRRVKQEKLEALKPKLNTQPRVWYKNLHLFEKEHICGSLVKLVDGVMDCAEDVKVDLYHEDKLIQSCNTDSFGDFKFDHIEKHSGVYRVVALASNLSGEITINFDRSINIGNLLLSA